ncbi:hypothetical protein H2203_006470 [Taxawa tesnikishii (nom. ined.)]|nr:hypothetical protein H2203_006470 [Dothideales sp. JES 119]
MGSFTFYDESYRPCYNEIHSPAIQINFHQAHIVEQTMTIEPNGATRSIGAVGYEQVNRNLTVQLDVIIHDVVAVTAAGGEMGIVIQMGTSPSSPVDLAPELVGPVNHGRAIPGLVVSNENVISIEDAPDACREFERHKASKFVTAFD